jgi:hypothetical protein
MTLLEHAFRLMQEEDFEEDAEDLGDKHPWWRFWDFIAPDVQEGNGWDESSNQIMSIFGLAIESAGAITFILTLIAPIWQQKVVLGWWEYAMIVLSVFDALFIIWGWVKYFDYYLDPSPETSFRAWRSNWLAGTINIPVTGLYTLWYVLWTMYLTAYVYRSKYTTTDPASTTTPPGTITVYSPEAGYKNHIWYIWFYTGAWLGITVGWFMTWFIKNIWYIYDPKQAVSYTDFDWFGLSSALAAEKNYY